MKGRGPHRHPLRRPPGTVAEERAGGWTLAGYAGLLGFFALETFTRRRGSASSLAASDADRGTTRALVASYGLATLLPLVLRWVPISRLPRPAAPLGLGIEMSGLALRWWSMRSLGRAYSRTLRVEGQQQVVQAGPYRWLRHPGYTGSLLTWLGFALATRRLPAVAAVGGLMGTAYRRRIDAEEVLLRRALPGYADYAARTQRLVPFVW